MGELKYFDSVAKMSDFSVLNSKWTRGRCKIMYTGRNRNHTDITESALNKLIENKGYANVPVVAHLYKGDDGKWRVGGHDSRIVITEDSFDVIDETVPFGVIPEDCNPAFEDVTETSGEVKRYFCVDVILWTHRYNIMDATKSDELWFNQSMEIDVNHGEYDKDYYYIIDDFDLSALCLLNHDPYNKENEVEPCFPSAGVSKFELDKLKQEFKLMFDDFKNLYKEVRNLEMNKVKSVLDSKYFAVQVTDNTVIAMDKETFKVYSIPVVEEKDGEISFDYDKATEKYVSVSDNDTGFSVSAVKQYVDDYANSIVQSAEAQYAENLETAKVEAVKEVTEKYDALMGEYNEVKDRCDKAEQKVNEYTAAEQKAAEDAHKAKIDSVIADYSAQLATNAEYVLYKNGIDYSKTEDQVKNDMLIILGKQAKNGANFAHKYSASWGAGDTPKPTQKNSRYGNLFDDFKD